MLDGIAQLASPARASLALLAVDAQRPWGRARSVAPRGDLYAPLTALVDACDGIVSIADDRPSPPDPRDDIPGQLTTQGIEPTPKVAWCARVVSAGARIGHDLLSWETMSLKRVGILCALARPDRIVHMLAARGVVPSCVFRAPDHGPCTRRLLDRARRAGDDLGIDVWLTTPKCAPHFRAADADGAARRSSRHVRERLTLRAPLGVIEHALALPDDLRARLRRLAAP